MQNVHHDRLMPMKENVKDNYDNQKPTIKNNDYVDDLSASKSESDQSAFMEKNEHEIEHRYPSRVRQQRNLEGTIPWDAINM